MSNYNTSSYTHGNTRSTTNTEDRNDDVVIVSALRTPMCRARKGALSTVFPHTLLETVVKATLERTCSSNSSTANTQHSSSKFCASDIDDISVGNVLMPPSGFAAMRMAAIASGIPATSTSLYMVNRQCASGLEAVAQIANAIATGQIKIGIGAGVESMSTYPMHKMKPPEMDWNCVQNNLPAMDCLVPMGITSENVVKKYNLQREALDEFALRSHQKATQAQLNGSFDAEIVSVGTVSRDDGIRPSTTLEGLSNLKPVFDVKTGVTTAGNSSQTTDGAAAVLLMTRSEANRRCLPILGVWRGYVTKGVPPHIMGIGPAYAIPAVLERTGLHIDDIDIFEINEAFASQATWCVSELNIPLDKVNPNGGAIALGHPLGCTGARMVATLLHELHRSKKRLGVISMCIGTGMGAAAVLEVEPNASL